MLVKGRNITIRESSYYEIPLWDNGLKTAWESVTHVQNNFRWNDTF